MTFMHCFFLILVNWLYVWWSRKHSQSSGAFAPVYSIGSLPQTTEVSDDEGTREPNNDTTAAPPPLSPVEIRQLTTTLGRLYTSCMFQFAVDYLQLFSFLML